MQLLKSRSIVSGIPSSIPNDNRGQWFLADSKHPVADLEHRFRKRKVGSILYERIGGILPGPRRKTLYIQIQLVTNAILRVDLESKEPVWGRVRSYAYNEDPWPEWGVEICLRELGVELRQIVAPEIVLTAYHYKGRG